MNPQPELANALRILMDEQKNGFVIDESHISTPHLNLLKSSGFLVPILRGWSLSTRPEEPSGSTQWHASFWEFAAKYLQQRNGESYCLNPEASLDLQTGVRHTPKQTVVITSGGGGQVQTLPFGTSMLFYPRTADSAQLIKERVHGVWVMSIEQSLVELTSRDFFLKQKEIEIALAKSKHVESFWTLLWNHGTPKISSAERIVGALRFVLRTDDADSIVTRFKREGVLLRRTNPFKDSTPLLPPSVRETSPYALRLRTMWASWRQDVIDAFPAPNQHLTKEHQLQNVDERHKDDAYHSLSIEGYKVTAELIERVERGDWDPHSQNSDKKDQDAMAASGYYKSFLAVRDTISLCLDGNNAGHSVKRAMADWHYSLFSPSVDAGILKKEQLYGFRTGPIFIRNSKHTPLPKDALMDAMDTFFDLLTNEPESSVRAVLGHHLFVFIHPYFDGNGRLGRFLMNTMLVAGGYPWTIVKMEQKSEYMEALESASVQQDIKPFARFLANQMTLGLTHDQSVSKKSKL
jgi:Fic family protein